jgi:hypothetical protein
MPQDLKGHFERVASSADPVKGQGLPTKVADVTIATSDSR